MATSDQPLVSVIMPAYNHERFVEQAIRSVWGQTYRQIELIVIDDGSRDETGAIAERLRAESPIPMRVIRKANEGIGKTLNLGLAMAQGDWVSFLASDDAYASHKIEAQLRYASELGPEYGCIHADAYLISEQGEPLGLRSAQNPLPPLREECFDALIRGSAECVAISVFIRTELLRAINGFDKHLLTEDFDIHLRLSQRTRYAYLEQPLVYSRIVASSLGRSPERIGEHILLAVAKHRAMLGERRYQEIIRTRCLAIFQMCLWYQHRRGVPIYAARALAAAGSPRLKLETAGALFLITCVYYAKQRVGALLSPALKHRLSRWYTGRLWRYVAGSQVRSAQSRQP